MLPYERKCRVSSVGYREAILRKCGENAPFAYGIESCVRQDHEPGAGAKICDVKDLRSKVIEATEQSPRGHVIGRFEEHMSFPERPDPHACARQTLALLPPLRQWVTGRVQEAGDCEGISLRQFAALRGIQGGASSPGDLARLWRVTPAVITGILDRLERRKLVRREPDPVDRRRLRLALTAEGEQVGHNIDHLLTGALAEQLATRSPDELAELQRSLWLLDCVFRDLGAGVAGQPPASADDMPCWDDDPAELTAILTASGERL